MSVLVPFLPYDPSETPLSFAARLASFHVGERLVPFLHDIGIRPSALAGCEFEAVEQLAAISGVACDALHRNAAHRIGKRRFELRGHELTAEFFASPDTVFCPACLVNDDEGAVDVAASRRGKLEWTMRPVHTCPLHGLALVRRSKRRWDDQYRELAYVVPERGQEVGRLIDEAKQRSISPLQDYVCNRLNRVIGPTWLDGQTLEQAVRSSEMLGMRIQFGASKKPSEMTSDEWDLAGRAGFEVTSQGEPAIREALLQMQAEYRQEKGKPGCRKIFGPFYEWLSSTKCRKDAGDITRILREHILDTMEVAGGQAVLGHILSERRLHSPQSLASETGLDPRTLRNVLAARGLVPAEAKDHGLHVFDARLGREVAQSVRRVTHVSALPKVLGCTRPLADQLLDERLILPVSEGQSYVPGRVWKGVDNREVARFLETLQAEARHVDTAPHGMVSIPKAAEKAKLLSVEIVHLILGGFLQNIARLNGLHGYSGVLVDPTEVRRQSEAVLAGMSAFTAFSRLKIPKATGWTLVERRSGPHLDPMVIDGLNGRHRIYRFSEETVEGFLAEFTTEARVATQCDIQRCFAVAHLKKAGVRPALHFAEAGMNFYRVAEIPALVSV